ncbi:MAG: HAMP domain-containing protein, partial [Chitinophagaceae bacterium]
RMILIICGAALLVACIAFFIYEFITYRNISRNELATLGRITAFNSSAALMFGDEDAAEQTLLALKAHKNIAAAVLYNDTGAILATYPDTIPAKESSPVLKDSSYQFDGNFIMGFEPVVEQGKRVGTLFLKADMQTVYNRFAVFGMAAFSFFVVVLLFTYLFSRRLQRSVTEPILYLAGIARQVSSRKDYSVRAEKKSSDEIGELTEALNAMLTQIERQNDEIRSLNATLEEKIVMRTWELQQANYALTEQNEFIQTIIDSSVNVIVVYDKDLNYLMLNKMALQLYNKKREDVIGRHVLEIFPTLENRPVYQNLKTALQGEFIHVEAYRSEIYDAWFENFFIPLRDKDDQVDRVLLIAHEITGIMQAKEKLQLLNTELEKSNRDLEQFAYVASHDLQEPLRKIMTFSDLSERNANNPEIQKRYLQKISSSAERMTSLIKEVLNYSRLSNNNTPSFTEVDLNAIVEQIKDDLELSLNEKSALIECDRLPVIRGIPLQLSQLFLNLFTNSLKFTDKTPHITIRARPLPEDGLQGDAIANAGAYVQIIFSDNGIGFEQKYADRIFSIFQRLHAVDRFDGTGIGLALCKKIIESHGGWIAVSSEPGKGTSFFLTLPYDPQRNPAISREATHENDNSLTR